jgi:uncharacterized membrane protein
MATATSNPAGTRHSTADPLVRAVRSVEESTALDPAVHLVDPVAEALVDSPEVRDALRGRWLGHALHPLLTDLPLGFWMSATALDLLGGRPSRPAATMLTALGVATALPTALTGLAEFGPIEQRDKRVAVVHAAANSVALACYTASLSARLRGRHLRGMAMALAGGTAALAGGYLGGHLTEVRKVSSHNPEFDEPAAPGPSPAS